MFPALSVSTWLVPVHDGLEAAEAVVDDAMAEDDGTTLLDNNTAEDDG